MVGKIGRFCSIGPNVRVVSGKHPINYVSTSPVFFSVLKQCGKSFVTENRYDEKMLCCDENGEKHSLILGNDVWIGDSVIIKAGVRIGDGAIIGMGSVVTKDVPPYAIVGGNPAKVIRYRFDENTIEILKSIKWWDWDDKKLSESTELMENINQFIEVKSNRDKYNVFL